MSIQLEEELSYFPQSEAQMCFEEAKMKLAELSANPTITGKGPVWVEHRRSYYCASTDACAGSYLAAITYVPDREAALELINELHIAEGFDMDSDYTIMPPEQNTYSPEFAPAEEGDFSPF